MKKLYLALSFLLCLTCFGQEAKTYEYYLYLNDFRNAPMFEKKGDFSYYIGKDAKMEAFFNKYSIINFKQAFPDFVKSEKILSVYLLRTIDKNLLKDIISEYPSMFSKYDDITGMVVEPLAYYPNDFGNTSPVTNLGADVSKKDLQYLDAPEAWEITKGNSDIIIGISDGPINANDPDFINKVQFVNGYNNGNFSGISHGTDVAAIAAARGNNGHGTVGVCMDCNILAAPMSFPYGATLAFNNLLRLAVEGAQVINMSWHNGFGYLSTLHEYGYIQVEQDIINYLVEEYKVIFVAAAGNMPSYSTPQSYHSFNEVTGLPPATPFGKLYMYPASYDNVISVSNVSHLYPINLPMNNNQPSYCCTSPFYPYHVLLENSVSTQISTLDPMNPVAIVRNGYNYYPWNPDGLIWAMATTNEVVDIVAPGYEIFQYSYFLNGQADKLYGWGTSYAAPQVSGTIGLMLSVMDCLTGSEAEDILKLTTKDIEVMPLNEMFVGNIGAGSLNTGNAVKFVDQMQSATGNAVIKNHLFNRFNFNLRRINNNLSIENVVFTQLNTSDFTAHNNIDVINSDFSPNSQGFVDLKIDETISVECAVVNRGVNRKETKKSNKIIISKSIIYPNPNNGNFTLSLSNENKESISIDVFDVFGKSIYQSKTNEETMNLNLPNLNSGVYFVKLTSLSRNETLKFIKQ